MTSEIDKLKHFHIENYSGTNFTDDLNDGEEFLYTTIRCKDDKEVTLLCKYVKNKHIGNCPDCVFNKYLCYGLLCNVVVLKELKLAGYGNSGMSAPWEINLVQKLCDWDIISPLRFTDDEWSQISSDGTCQNRRKSDVFKEPDGSIHYNGAFNKRPISRYNFNTKEWTENKNPICWSGGLFEYKDNILTGRYFNQCHLLLYKINKGWTPRPTITIDCVEIEIAPDNWIMAVDANNTNLLLLNVYYNIQWEECSCLRGIRLEDVTVELEKEAYEKKI